jgi:ZIP family zinc transporter
MIQALLLGALAQTSLILSGLIVYRVRVPPKVVGAMAGFGAGSLLGTIAFSLLPEAEELVKPEISLWPLIGALVFLVSDRIIEQRFGGEGAGEALGIVVGAVVDGVPGSLIFGIQLATGQPISAAFLLAVWIRHWRPQSISFSRGGALCARVGCGLLS